MILRKSAILGALHAVWDVDCRASARATKATAYTPHREKTRMDGAQLRSAAAACGTVDVRAVRQEWRCVEIARVQRAASVVPAKPIGLKEGKMLVSQV